MMRLLFLLPLLVLLGGCGTMADPREWFDGDSGQEPAELKPIQATIKPVTLWSVDVGEGARRYNRLVAVVEGEKIYTLSAEGVLQARVRENGSLLWQVETGLPASAGPGVGEELLLVGTSEGQVVAFSQVDGSELWRRQLSSEVLAVPAIGDGMVVVHTEDGNLYGLDAAGGEQRWIYNQAPPVLTLHGTSSPVISGGTVFCGLAGGKLVALTLETGMLEWEGHVTIPSGGSELERMVDVDADPLVYSGTVYAAAYQGDVVAVGEGSGKVFWKRRISVYNNMAVNWQQLSLSDAQGFLWSLDPDSGAARWRVQELQYRHLSPPAILGDYVVVGDFEGYLHWFAADDGSPVARMRIGSSPIVAQPVVADEVLYVLSTDGTLAAVRLPEEE
jgi:outer membrane protein assembly factor BamB